ncbi:unnamed protein product [Brassica oleracea]|uniref:STL11/RBM22-like N-terminal domain-containing protein n=1 Tax=Brassica oleracea TaxID=3712 RepID=A0A3P6FHW1_BRAOL|nr:unnamed protein product [Brassica oleracea]
MAGCNMQKNVNETHNFYVENLLDVRRKNYGTVVHSKIHYINGMSTITSSLFNNQNRTETLASKSYLQHKQQQQESNTKLQNRQQPNDLSSQGFWPPETSDLPNTQDCPAEELRDPTNPYLRIVLATYKKECKIRTRTFTMFRWQPGRTERYKKPEICQTYSKLKNICQVCLLDLENGLPVQDKDTAPNITTQEKEKHFSAVEEDINHKTSLLEKEKDQLRKLCLDDLRGQNLKCLAESDGLAVKKTKVEREHTSVKKGRVTKKQSTLLGKFSLYIP